MNRRHATALLPLALLLGACSPPPAASTTVATPTAGNGPAQCQHHQARQVALQLEGVRAISLEVGPDTLVLNGQPAADGQLSGRACASSADQLDGLQVTQKREGDTLHVRLENTARRGISLGNHYAWLDLAGSIPSGVPVTLALGSGDVTLDNLAALDASVGSGDLQARRIAGAVNLTLGSGDADIDQAASLDATVGSGDIKAGTITGSVALTVGSGDVKLGSSGELALQALGSGDVDVGQVNSNVRIGSVGSGDITLERVSGSVDAQTIASGSLQVNQAGGDLRVGTLGSGDVQHRNIGGAVQLPRNH